MLAHAFITVMMLAAVNYRVFEAANAAGAVERFRHYAKNVTKDLEAATAALPGELLNLRAAPAVGRIMKANLASGVGGDGRTLQEDRADLAERCRQLLVAAALRQCRMLGVAD